MAIVTAKANNVQITGTSVSGSNITFNISWENSWNASAAPANWDAVWVFVKYQDCNTKLWAHADLSSTAADHTAASPLQVDPVTDGKGVFIRRSAVGGGNIASTSITLKMSTVSGTANNYKVYGIEMVNVPQGAFQLGDGVSGYGFSSITVDANSQSNGLTTGELGPYSADLQPSFPMGYNSFYMMKYEISQEQYADFLNSLTFTQQKNRVVNDPISAAGSYAMFTGYQYRNGLAIVTPGSNGAIPAVFGTDATSGTPNSSNDGQNVAMNHLSWADLASYLDWAALRPMTEMEFEKAARGTLPRVSGEYPWGSADITQSNSTQLTNAKMANEISSVTVNNGMCNYGSGTYAATYGPT
ncbi:MAG TPA: SUMF1/EgtB/PvdO family nonheme iron enzyme, partial [Kaistella sp.]|nr:SUMF1/EgtB/PvdO family nonheme iron enzyme [Kaistella sp.]